MKFIKIFLIVALIISAAAWKQCSETFCGRVRKSPMGYEDRYSLELKSVIINNGNLEANLVQNGLQKLKLVIMVYEDYTVHMQINEIKPTIPRYQAEAALDKEHSHKTIPLKILNKTSETVKVGSDKVTLIIDAKNFMTEIYLEDKQIAIINSLDRFVFETEGNNLAIGMGVTFLETQYAYGIPEHADRLVLQDTIGKEPYRHFNLDYGHYRINSTEALYGAIGVLYAHGTTHSSGIFWLNSAQTWIDISINENKVDSFFMSESGILEMYILTGPTFAAAVKQYTKITGTAPLPPYFSLGYHQSRYSYMTQVDVLDVIKYFDRYDFPVDSVWLDIDYTEEKKYFTWDPVRFANPEILQDKLAETNRKLVAIIDPHIKVDDKYFLHTTAVSRNYYVKYENKSDFQGKCWPGLSSYIDFFNPEALEYYSDLYATHHFQGKNIHVWNDMNEPAVFEDGDNENTMSSNLTHNNTIKHRDVHNLYGFYQVIGTHKGLLKRQPNQRPFILTRSHFAGIQRYATIWTGDNVATWDYLQISIPMCLTEALAGVSFCGADVGGFANIPNDELYQRWYQAGIWLPFYRGHSAIDVPRREPYLYEEDIQKRVRAAMRLRYAHLPVWYTLFREHEISGEPVIRPITYHYPTEKSALTIDNQIMIGLNILAAPVLIQQVTSINVYLPGGESEIWFNINENFKMYTGNGYNNIHVNIDSNPAFYRGGSIITRKDTPRAATMDTQNDTYTVYICLNKNQIAEGTLYIDDYESFNYKTKNEYIYVQLSFDNNIFSSKKIDTDANYNSPANINKAIIINPPKNIVRAKFIEESQNDESQLQLTYSSDKTMLTIDNLSIKPENPFKIELRSSSTKLSATLVVLSIICFIYN